MKIIHMKTQKDVMNAQETADYIGVCVSKIRQWIRDKWIPFVPLDGRIVFLTEEITKWLKSKQITPTAEKLSSEESSAIISNKLWHKAINN
jgi:hypothetical protein